MAEVYPLPVRPITDRESAFAFVLGVLYNQQTQGTRAWRAPYVLGQRMGGLTPERVMRLGPARLGTLFAAKPAIHPFTQRMSLQTFAVARIITEKYNGDARNIWTPTVTAEVFVSRMMALPGIGEHKARIALFVATVVLGVRVRRSSGNYSIRSCGSLAQIFHPIHEPKLTR